MNFLYKRFAGLLGKTFEVICSDFSIFSYMAPEITKRGNYGKPVDLWAIGCLTFAILSGAPPFDYPDEFEYDFSNLLWGEISDTAKNFIKRLLVIEPSGRMTASEALEHPWLKMGENAGSETLPNLCKHFDPKKQFRKAVEKVKLVHQFRKKSTASISSDEDLVSDENGRFVVYAQ